MLPSFLIKYLALSFIVDEDLDIVVDEHGIRIINFYIFATEVYTGARMQKNKLGNTEIEVPNICLGTMTWGQQNTEEEAHEQLDYAVEEKGLKFIDTAEVYPIPPTGEKQGLTETYIGNWLNKRGKRDDLFVASKVCVAPFVSTRDIGERARYNKKQIHEAIDGTLSRLQTDHVDLYQIHWPERTTNFFGARGYEHNAKEETTPIQETLETLGELVKAGKVKNIGVSNETPWGVSEYLRLAREENLPRIVSIQNQYSLTNRTYEIGLAEFAMREQVGLLAYSVLGMGVLTGKYLDGVVPAGSRFDFSDRNLDRYNPTCAQEAVRRYVAVAKDDGLDPATMAIAFARSREFTTSTIIGARTMDQLKVAIDASTVELSDEVLTAINEVHCELPDITV